MHESSMVMSILEIAKETLAAHGGSKISKITLVLGELACVETHSLISCFEIFSEGTAAEGAELVFEKVPAMKRCLSCGMEFARLDSLERCSACDGELSLGSGREFYLKSLELEADVENSGAV